MNSWPSFPKMPKPANKPIIAVDIDDVIVSEAEFVVDYSNKHWGHSLSLEDYSEHWGKMWKVGAEEVERRADMLHAPGMIRKYSLLEDAHYALIELSKKFRLIILTSRRKIVEGETKEWLNENFGDIFEKVHFTGFWDTISSDSHLLTKADLVQELEVDYLIDDQPKHCFGAAEHGVQAVLFGDYAESRDLDLPDGVTRCKNWQEVLRYFENEKG
jgi:5'(3')-deoxyribonucleotidase